MEMDSDRYGTEISMVCRLVLINFTIEISGNSQMEQEMSEFILSDSLDNRIKHILIQFSVFFISDIKRQECWRYIFSSQRIHDENIYRHQTIQPYFRSK